MSCQTNSCKSCCEKPSIVNGLQNQVLDLYNRTSYLSAPYALGPSLSSVIPSTAVTVSPVQGCGNGYNFAASAPNLSIGGPAPGAVIGPGAVVQPTAVAPGSIAPAMGMATSLMPSVSSGYGVVSQTPGYSSTAVNSPYQSVGINNINAPYGTSSVSQQTIQNVLNGTPTEGNKPIQKTPAPQPDPRNIVGPAPPVSSSNGSSNYSSSLKNLITATGQSCNCEDDQSFSSAVMTDPMDYIPPGPPSNSNNGIQQDVNVAAYGAIPVSAPQPVGVAPGIAVGGVGGIAVTSPAFLGGVPNINAASGIAFSNECGVQYGLNAPLAVAGPIAPATSILGSNYLSNLASTPFWSGLNQSEPAAVMHSANPVYPGLMMLVRTWQGTPQVIISRPDKFGCPQFETYCPFDEHEDGCNCPKCNDFHINNCEYSCINNFGGTSPLSDVVLFTSIGTLTTETIPENTFYFTIVKATGNTCSSPFNIPEGGPTGVFNTSGLAIAVNGKVNRNILMYSGCTYTLSFSIDHTLAQTDSTLSALAAKQSLILTIDPCGQDTTAGNISTLGPYIQKFAMETGFPATPVGGLPVGQTRPFTPECKLFTNVLSTIYYQFFNLSYGGGPITILTDNC